MKKVLWTLGIILLSAATAVYASSDSFSTCDYMCSAPYDTNSGLRTFFSAVTGLNTITEKAAENALKKEILEFGSAKKLKVNIDSYSSKDLKNGIFKSAEINAKNAVIKNIYLSSIDLKTLCDFNYLKYDDGNLTVMENFPMSFNIEFSSNDLNNTMQSPKYMDLINNLTFGDSPIRLKIVSARAAIKNHKFYYILSLKIPFVRKPQTIVLLADINVKDGNFIYSNTKIVSGHFNLESQNLDSVLNYLNPLDFSVKIIHNKKANIKIKNVEIEDDKISTNGVVIIPKD